MKKNISQKYLNYLNEGIFDFNNGYYYLLEFNKNKFNKILYFNKYDMNEISSLKWVGYLFLLSDKNFKDLLSYETIKCPGVTNIFGKNNAIKTLKIISSLKILDRGTFSFNSFFGGGNISNIEKSKYFSSGDIIETKLKQLQLSIYIPVLSLFLPYKFYIRIK